MKKPASTAPQMIAATMPPTRNGKFQIAMISTRTSPMPPARDATVTYCHSRTRDLSAAVREADIVVAAVGRPRLLRGQDIKPGAVVIDVGMNTKPDPTKAKGTRLCGDVHFDSAAQVASKITPVPGGVGPMTIAMLLVNTVQSWRQRSA